MRTRVKSKELRKLISEYPGHVYESRLIQYQQVRFLQVVPINSVQFAYSGIYMRIKRVYKFPDIQKGQNSRDLYSMEASRYLQSGEE